MPKAIIIESFGGPSVLKAVNVDLTDPKPDQVQIRHTAIEVNFLDILQRKGLYGNASSGLNVPGVSAVGVIEKLGDKVEGFNIGEKVGYIIKSGGAYSEARNISAESIFAIPSELDDALIGSCLAKALTAHYLCNRAFLVRPANAVVIHAAASGVGKLLAQWCNGIGAYVFGTVGSDEKKQIALDNGCHHVFNYNTEDWVAGVRSKTQDIGVHVVFDSLGDKIFDQSLNSTMNMGVIVSYGSSLGPVQPIDPKKLMAKSLFVTMPSLFHYKASRMELVITADEVCNLIFDGTIKPTPPKIFKLSDAVAAHEMVENRANTTPVVLVP